MAKGTVRLGNKQYKTVALRVAEFRKLFTPADGWAIETEILEAEMEWLIFQARIRHPDGTLVAMGHARGSLRQPKDFEKMETVAVGRALAAFGLGGEEYASADELAAFFETKAPPAPKTPGGTTKGESDGSRQEDNPPDRSMEAWVRAVEALGYRVGDVNIYLENHGAPVPPDRWDETLAWLRTDDARRLVGGGA
jgi:hypothetical protein